MILTNPCRFCIKKKPDCNNCVKIMRYNYYKNYPLKKRIKYMIEDWIVEHKFLAIILILSLMLIIFFGVFLVIVTNDTVWEIYRTKKIWIDKDLGLYYYVREQIL